MIGLLFKVARLIPRCPVVALWAEFDLVGPWLLAGWAGRFGLCPAGLRDVDHFSCLSRYIIIFPFIPTRIDTRKKVDKSVELIF